MGLIPAAQPDEGGEATEDEGEEQAGAGEVEERYWKERKAAAQRAGPIGAADVAVCEQQLQRLADAAKAARPWVARMQAATHAVTRAQERRETATADLEAAQLVVTAMQKALDEATAAELAAKNELQAIKSEQAQPGAQEDQRAGPFGQALQALLQAARQTGMATTQLATVVAQAAAEQAQRQPPRQPPCPTPQDTQVYVPASLLDAALETQSQRSEAPMDTNSSQRKDAIAQKGRRSRSRGPGKEEDGLSDAGSVAVGGRPRHR